jgi:hypothetical protein
MMYVSGTTGVQVKFNRDRTSVSAKTGVCQDSLSALKGLAGSLRHEGWTVTITVHTRVAKLSGSRPANTPRPAAD